MKIIINIFVLLVPFWPLKLFILRSFYGYVIHKDAWIGFAYCFPDSLEMASGASVGHLTVVKRLDCLALGNHATIGRLNWVSGYSTKNYRNSYSHIPSRRSALLLDQHAAITHRHIIDCTDTVRIGEFSTVAGYNSQILTHTIDVAFSRQTASPITIGKYCFVGTSSLILHGAGIPDFTLIGAGSIVTKKLSKSYSLYAGAPARFLKSLDPNLPYFARLTGYVV